MQQLLHQTFHPIHSHLSTHVNQCYFSKIKPKRLTAAYQISVPANLLKFAGLKEQAIGNPTYQQNCKPKLTVTMEVTHLSATQKQGLGQQTAQFAFTTRRHIKCTARIEGALSCLHSPHSLLATRRGANINQNRGLFSLKGSVNKTSILRTALRRDCFLLSMLHATPHFNILN